MNNNLCNDTDKNAFKSKSKTMSLYFGTNIFCIIGVAYGILLRNSITVLFSKIIAILIAVGAILLLCIPSKHYIKKYLLAQITLYFEVYVNYTLFLFILLFMKNGGGENFWIYTICIILPALLFAGLFLLFNRKISRKKVTSPVSYGKIRLYSMMGGFLGLCFAKVFVRNFSNVALDVVIICLTLLTYAFLSALCISISNLVRVKNSDN